MTEFIINATALLILLVSAQIGMKSGAFSALSWMLASLLSLTAAMRYWFLLTRFAVTFGTTSLPLIAALCFGVLFVTVLLLVTRIWAAQTEEFESVAPSVASRCIGAVLGAGCGAVLVSAIILILSLVTPQYFPAEQPSILPVPLDHLPTLAYRYIETDVVGIKEAESAHTPLPRFRSPEEKPAVFWQ